MLSIHEALGSGGREGGRWPEYAANSGKEGYLVLSKALGTSKGIGPYFSHLCNLPWNRDFLA